MFLSSIRSSRRLARIVPSRRSTLLVLAACCVANSAAAQLITFTWHNGQNAASCGPLGGPLVQHSFSAPVTTHDSISVSDPGGATWGASQASSNMHAVLAPNGISLADSGFAHRAPLVVHGTGATADARDHWEFTLAAPARFTFSASLSASSTESTMGPQTFAFLGPQITPDPGSTPPPYAAALSSSGSITMSATGVLGPGQYTVWLTGRAEGTSWPFTGSYDNWLFLALDCGTLTSYCTAGMTTNGCTATIQGSGTPSASASNGFVLDVVGTEGGSQGLVFYGIGGRSAVAWGTSSSFLCVKPPTQRTGVQSGGGTPGVCDGALTLDWNQFVATHPSALGAPFSAGQLVQAQGWFRDPPSAKSTMLSDALEFVVCP